MDASWRWWPTVVIGFGALLALLPIFIRKRWMGLLYIIAAPIIATGIMLLISMTSGQWFLWARWWPIGVLSIALGFLPSPQCMRVKPGWQCRPSSSA